MLPLAASALVAALFPALAGAAPAQPRVLCARSCAQCEDYEFCEFSYQGCPAGHVACVSETADRHSLYRRYTDPPFESFVRCGTSYPRASCSAELRTKDTNEAGCEMDCFLDPSCAGFLWAEPVGLPQKCLHYATVGAIGASEPADPFFANTVMRTRGSCPGTTCPMQDCGAKVPEFFCSTQIFASTEMTATQCRESCTANSTCQGLFYNASPQGCYHFSSIGATSTYSGGVVWSKGACPAGQCP